MALLSELARDRYVRRTIPDDVFTAMSAELSSELGAIDQKLQSGPSSNLEAILAAAKAGELRGTVTEQHEQPAAMLEHIIIGPGTAGRRGFDAGRVTIVTR